MAQLLRMQLNLQHILDVIGALIHFEPSRNAMRSAFASRSKPADKPMGFFSKLKIGYTQAADIGKARLALPECIKTVKEVRSRRITHSRCLADPRLIGTPAQDAIPRMIKSDEILELTHMAAAASCQVRANAMQASPKDEDLVAAAVEATNLSIDEANTARERSDEDFAVLKHALKQLNVTLRHGV
jgi:hypothetical protein